MPEGGFEMMMQANSPGQHDGSRQFSNRVWFDDVVVSSEPIGCD